MPRTICTRLPRSDPYDPFKYTFSKHLPVRPASVAHNHPLLTYMTVRFDTSSLVGDPYDPDHTQLMTRAPSVGSRNPIPTTFRIRHVGSESSAHDIPRAIGRICIQGSFPGDKATNIRMYGTCRKILTRTTLRLTHITRLAAEASGIPGRSCSVQS